MLAVCTITVVNQTGSMIELSGFHHSMQLVMACMNIQEMLRAYYALYYDRNIEELL